MEFIGVGVAIHTIIQTCLNYEKLIAEKLRDINTAGEQLKKVTLFFGLNSSHLRQTLNLVERQLQSSLDDRTSSILFRVILEISKILGKFDSKLSKCFDERGGIKPVRFAFGTKASLEQYQREVDAWIDRLSNRLFLHWMSINLQSPSAPQIAPDAGGAATLQPPQYGAVQALRLNPTILPNLGMLEALEYSDAYLGKTPQGRTVVVELRYIRKEARFEEKTFIKESNHNIATMLTTVHAKISMSGDPLSKGILECAGYFSDDSQNICGIVYKLPDPLTSEPKSLRSLLWSPENRRGSRHDMNDRIALARSIAFAALAIHSAKFVHKNIRPSNILVLDPQTPGSPKYPRVIGHPAIVGFKDARPDEQDTERRSSSVWQNNIYRHPQRQPKEGEEQVDYDYTMMHDIYSLGVVFTEIAFWRPCIVPKKNESTGRIEIVHNPEFWGSLLEGRKKEDDPEKIRQLYLRLVRGTVPRTIGGRFAQVIEDCLNCLEEPVEEPAAELNPPELSEAEIGIAFMERVVEALEAICL